MTGIFGKGTSFSWNSQFVAWLTNVGGPEFSIDSVEVTNHQSSGRLKEFMAGLIDAGR